MIIAKITAANPKIELIVYSPKPALNNAPTIVIPEIAFEPDIKGVWSVGGTFVISSKPTNIASTKIYTNIKKLGPSIIETLFLF